MRLLNTRMLIGMTVIFIGCIVSGIFLSHQFISPSLCRNLSCVSIPGISSYRLKEMYTDTEAAYRALYASGTRYIRIEAQPTNAADAQKQLDASIIRMKALFEKAPAPYPGDISDTIVCDPSFAPRYETVKLPDGTNARYFVGYLNNRMTFGSCSQNQAVYKGIMMFMYCPANSLTLRVELIAPTKEFTAHEQEITQQMITMLCGKSN